MLNFRPLASGSSGNCTYIGNDNTHILIDAGLSAKKMESLFDISKISALFLTHEHRDHIHGAGIISRRYDIPIYATSGTWEAIDDAKLIGEISRHNKVVIYPFEKVILSDLSIFPFSIPHDALDPVGYSINFNDYKVTLATDMGHINDCIRENTYNSDVLLLECNHDIEMVKSGSYPYKLKERVLTPYGHLSNKTAANLLSDIINDKLKTVFLGHLSKQNNTTELALDTVLNTLATRGIVNFKTKIEMLDFS